MTEPLLKYPLIREGKKVPTDLQGKLIRDLIDVGWMSEQGLKWFGWDVDGWYAWTDSNGMIHRIRDLKRNENGKRFEKEVTNIVRGDEPRDDIFASAHQLYQHELDLSKDCQLCPVRVVEHDDTEETTDNQGTKKEVDVIAPPWQTYAGGNPPDHGGINTGSNPNVASTNYGGYGDGYTEYTPPTANPGETVNTDGVTDTTKAAGGSNTPAKEGGKTTTSIYVTQSPAAPPPKQYIPGGSKSNAGGFIWDGKQDPPAKIPGSVGTYGVVPTNNTNQIPNYPPNKNPYQNSYNEPVYSLEEFTNGNIGIDYFDIINQRPSSSGMPGGPTMRYVRNPTDRKVMDMRHVMVVGFLTGNIGGGIVEIFQGLSGLVGSSIAASAFDMDDFYSNNIGAKFNKDLNKKVNIPNNPNNRYNWRNNWVKDFNNFIKNNKF